VGFTVGQTFVSVPVERHPRLERRKRFSIYHFTFFIETKCGGLLTCPWRNGEVSWLVSYCGLRIR